MLERKGNPQSDVATEGRNATVQIVNGSQGITRSVAMLRGSIQIACRTSSSKVEVYKDNTFN